MLIFLFCCCFVSVLGDCGDYVWDNDLVSFLPELSFRAETELNRIGFSIRYEFQANDHHHDQLNNSANSMMMMRNSSFAIAVYVDDELSSIAIKNPEDTVYSSFILDWFRPLAEKERMLCILLFRFDHAKLEADLREPFAGNTIILQEYRGHSNYITDSSLLMDPELLDAFETVGSNGRRRNRLISLGRLNGVQELLRNNNTENNGDEWTAVHFEFSVLHGGNSARKFSDETVLTINIGTCEEDEECVWSIIADTLKSVENADEPWDLLNVEMASCPDTVMQRIINLAKPKVVRVVYPGAIPLGIDMKVSFDSRLEPLQRSAIESGGYGCSLSHLWSLVTPMGYDLWTCTRRRPHFSKVNDDHFSNLAQTRAAIFIQTSNTNFEFGSHSKALVTCTKPFYEPRCDGLRSGFIQQSVSCERIGVEFMKNKAETIDKLEKSLQLYFSILLTGDKTRRVECRESSVLWEDILNSSSSEKEGELAWMFKASALVSSVIGTNPLSIRSIELDSQLYPDSLNQLIKKLEHLSSSLSNNNNNNNNHHQDIIIYQPAVSSGFRIEFAHMGSTELFLGIKAVQDDGEITQFGHGRAVVVRISGPAVSAVAMVIPEYSSPATAKFPSSLPPGRYIVEVVEQLRGNYDILYQKWKPRLSWDKGVRHEIGVIEIPNNHNIRACTKGEDTQGPGYWIKVKNMIDHKPPLCRNIDVEQDSDLSNRFLLNPHWHFVFSGSPSCAPPMMCGIDAFQCLRYRKGPVVFLGDSHARDLYMESVFLFENFQSNTQPSNSQPSNLVEWHYQRMHMKHGNQSVRFYDVGGSSLQHFASLYLGLHELVRQLPEFSQPLRFISEKLHPDPMKTESRVDDVVLGSDSIVIISVGLGELDLFRMDVNDLNAKGWKRLCSSMEMLLEKIPGLQILLTTIPAVSGRTYHIYETANQEMKRIIQARMGNRVTIVDYSQLFMADTERQWTDRIHAGAACFLCDGVGRPIMRTTMSLLLPHVRGCVW